jgi:hypothetical protein
MIDPRHGDEGEWQRLLADPPPAPEPGFTLRVLAALPGRRRAERLRAQVLLAAAVVAGLCLAVILTPALAGATRPTAVALVLALPAVALAFWTVLTVAD